MNTFNSRNLRFDKLSKYAFGIIDYFQLMVLAMKNVYIQKVKSRPISLIVHKISVQWIRELNLQQEAAQLLNNT